MTPGDPLEPKDRTAGSGAEAVEECHTCRGFGWYTLDVERDHPDFGKAFICECRQRAHRLRYLKRIEAVSYLKAVQDKTFSSFLQEPPGYGEAARASLRAAHRVCREFADAPAGWILLAGPNGCGKTHLAAALANELAAAETPVLMLTVPSLLDRLRATFAPDAPHTFDELYGLVEGVDVLVLDDLGAQSSTPWAAEKLFQLLNERHVRGLPTVITTNLQLWEFEPRVQSRLGDVHLVRQAPIQAPDYRIGVPRPGDGTWADLNSLDLHRSETFDTIDVRRVDGRGAQQRLEAILQQLGQWLEEPRGWLVLSGPPGSGKTHLAAALANRWSQAGCPVLFAEVEDLKDYFLRTIRADGDAAPRRTAQLRSVPFLVLDGYSDTRDAVRRGSGWTEKQLRRLLVHRFDAGLATVITVHVEPERWEGWFHHRAVNARRSRHFLLDATGTPRA